MKKIDLIHTTILIVGILCGYSALQILLSSLTSYSYYLSDIYYTRSAFLGLPGLVQAALLFVACIVLIRNGRKYATALLRSDPTHRSEPSDDSDEDAAGWQLDRRNMIFVLFIGLGLYTLIQNIPPLLSDFFNLFRDRVRTDILKRPPYRDYLAIDLLRLTVGAIFLYAAAPLTNFIDNKIAARLGGASKSR
jgi:hypothetical protein